MKKKVNEQKGLFSLQTWDSAKNVTIYHQISQKKFYNSDTRFSMTMTFFWGQCYKTFYVRNLEMYEISKSVYALPTQSNLCGLGHETTQEWSSRKVLPSGKLQPHSQILDSAKKAGQA
jgi:hypothetical protein